MINVNLNELLGLIEVSGPDSKTFLQGQLTNDITILDTENTLNGEFQYSAYLNTKGRMIASFWIKKINTSSNEDIYFLITNKDIIDKLMAKLKMYVLRAKVTIQKSEKHLLFTNNSTFNNDEYIRLSNNNFIVFSDSEANGYSSINTFKEYLINNGIPLIYPETQEQLIPQHANFDEIGGLNFKKGCYLGQEIVARMHYLGRSKRKMYKFKSDYEVKVGQPIVSPKLNNQEVGIIIDVVAQNQKYIGLVALQNDCIDTAFLDIENTKLLSVNPIKYS